MTMIERFEALLAAGRDDALLRFGLGSEYLRVGNGPRAVENLHRALEHDPHYSAAWKLLGKALEGALDPAAAMQAYRRGIEVAEGKGDKQAAREMGVFLKRLERAAPAGEEG